MKKFEFQYLLQKCYAGPHHPYGFSVRSFLYSLLFPFPAISVPKAIQPSLFSQFTRNFPIRPTFRSVLRFTSCDSASFNRSGIEGAAYECSQDNREQITSLSRTASRGQNVCRTQ